jgi:hypothetical protein
MTNICLMIIQNANYIMLLNQRIKDYNIGICCFSAKHTSLRSKSKDWLTWNQDNILEWSDMTILSVIV